MTMAYVMLPASKVIRMCQRTVETVQASREEARELDRKRCWLLKTWPVEFLGMLAGLGPRPEAWMVGLGREYTARELMRLAKLAEDGPDKMVRIGDDDLEYLEDCE
jgi:hypothetical protein